MYRTLLLAVAAMLIFNSCIVNFSGDVDFKMNGKNDAKLIVNGNEYSKKTISSFNQNRKIKFDTEGLEDYKLPIEMNRNYKGVKQIFAASGKTITNNINSTTKLFCDSISYDLSTETYDLTGTCHTDYVVVTNDKDTTSSVVKSDYHVTIKIDMPQKISRKILPVVIQDYLVKQLDEQAQKLAQN
ncbi:hypothetical protein EYV94_21115 [Puteibacter caeruleilacunae]|nr:hypothetical protein EYV94_21115 [Puteibacter caeruleilacunae]